VAEAALRDAALRDAPLWINAASGVIRRLPAGRYRAMNAVARWARGPFWARLPRELGRLEFRCDLRDALMREACLTGRYEPQETAILQQLLRPGMTFVDVGANWGYFTLVGAHLVGAAGRVIAVEADPRACRTVQANLNRNAHTHVVLHNAAAADAAGRLALHEYEPRAGESGNFGVGRASNPAGGRMFEIASCRLDDLLDDDRVERIDLLKMDIEGGEASALVGLDRRLSERRVDRVLLELHPRQLRQLGSSVESVIGDMRRRGFTGWSIDHSRAAHTGASSGRLDVRSLLAPLGDGPTGEWPHVLWLREGLTL
jgi:FkbM family methyltransferase